MNGVQLHRIFVMLQKNIIQLQGAINCKDVEYQAQME